MPHESADEPRPYAAMDAVAMLPALGGLLSLVGGTATLGLWAAEIGGPGLNDTLATAGLVSWLLAGSLATTAVLVARAHVAKATVDRRSTALPATALALALAVEVGCLAFPVATCVASRYHAPTVLGTAYSSALTAPWSAMDLSTTSGTVGYSDDENLSVTLNKAAGAAVKRARRPSGLRPAPRGFEVILRWGHLPAPDGVDDGKVP